MKLLTSFAAMGMLFAHEAQAQRQIHIPLDCYQEGERVYGIKQGNRLSDLNLISGLDASSHRLTSLTACYDQSTNLISGVTTNYGIWSGDSITNPKRLNIFGNMSGLHTYNLSDSAVSKDEQIASFGKLWWKVANPDEEEWSSLSRQDNYSDMLEDNFKKADVDRSGALNLEEFDQFYHRVRAEENRFDDQWSQGSDNYKGWGNKSYNYFNFNEKMYAYFEACHSLNGSSGEETCTKSNFTKTEDIIRKWMNDGKMSKTGYLYDQDSNSSTARVRTSGRWLSHHCKTLELDSEDSITYLKVTSGTFGVEALELMTKKQPYWSVDARSSSSAIQGGSRNFAYKNDNWIKTGAEFGKEMFGLFGYVNTDTGDLNGIGFVEKDTQCVKEFKDNLGGSYSWISPKTGKALSPPERPQEYEAQIVKLLEAKEQIESGKLRDHEHDDEAEVALVVITVLIYVALMAVVGVLIYQYCQEKKAGNVAGRFN